jgi:hypothetical protein
MPRALLMVRAELQHQGDLPAFDRWYETEHLPQAVAAFAAERAWRCWSETAPGVHYAFYEFADVPTAKSSLQSPAMTALVAEFDRCWGARITRERQILGLAQHLPAAPSVGPVAG